ncbi:MAG: hypothetical protein QHH26_12705 [Armatimonadota bacterium]|nr:hypothetical protein [Armatimonadota bacterium]
MNRWIRYFLAFILLLSVSGHAGAVYTIKPSLTETELLRLYVDMLRKYVNYAEKQWHAASFPNAGYWGNGISDGNEGIRAVANTALTYAVLAKHADKLANDERLAYISRAASGIRYAVETHLTGKQKCVDGRQWGNSWQSAMWAGNIGFAAWIIWDDLDDDLRTSVERVVSFEADRFLHLKPPSNRWGDTKAEEIGWNQICISLAANMFPSHPNALKWKEKSIEYMMNVLSIPQDARDERIVDGKRVRDWVCTVNVHPDFTLENHGFFHPTYTMVSPAEVGQGGLLYAYAHQPIPEAAGHHLLDNWRLLQNFMLPCGYWIYPQGMDWALNSDGHIHYLAWLATYAKDPLAAGMEKRVAQYIAGHQTIHKDGRFAGPASRLGFAREAVTAERLSYSYLYHKIVGSGPENEGTIDQMNLKGVRRYPLIDVITHHTSNKFASFSWKNKIMGLVMPIGFNHGANPYFCTPFINGLVGNFIIKNVESRKAQVVERTWRRLEDGFETSGTLLLGNGLLKQEIKLISIGDKTVVYMDKVTAQSPVAVLKEFGVPVGIENDEFTGNQRTLYYEGGEKTILGPKTAELIRIPGRWANVDGRLGMVVVLGSGIAYDDVAAYNRDGAREDILYGSYSDIEREFKTGEEVARRIVIFFTEVKPDETARLAKAVKLEKDAEGNQVLVLKLPEKVCIKVERIWSKGSSISYQQTR